MKIKNHHDLNPEIEDKRLRIIMTNNLNLNLVINLRNFTWVHNRHEPKLSISIIHIIDRADR